MGQPGERLVGNIGVSQLLQHLPRVGSGKNEHSILGRDVPQVNAAVPRHQLLQEVQIVVVRRTTTDQEETLAEEAVLQLRNRKLRADRAGRIERMRKADAAHFLRDVIGDDAVKERVRDACALRPRSW